MSDLRERLRDIGRIDWQGTGRFVEVDAAVAAVAECLHAEQSSEHIVRHDPARTLREVAAHRALLAEHALTVTKIHTTPYDPYTGQPKPDEYEVVCARTRLTRH